MSQTADKTFVTAQSNFLEVGEPEMRPLAGPAVRPGPQGAASLDGPAVRPGTQGRRALRPWMDRRSGQGRNALHPWSGRQWGQGRCALRPWPDRRSGQGRNALHPWPDSFYRQWGQGLLLHSLFAPTTDRKMTLRRDESSFVF